LSFPPLKNTVLPHFGYQMSIFFFKLYIKLKPLISSLLWNLHHENISLRSKVIPINILKIPVLVFRHWKILSCHELGYQMSIFFFKLYIKLKPLISSLLWNLHHENISFRSKVIPINVLENTCPGFKPSPSKIDKQHTL
jgi:hypothetical protein